MSPTRANGRRMPPGICRVDQESTRTHGFVVRVGYHKTAKGWRPKHTAFFGDASHGSKKKALDAASSWLKKVQRTGRVPARKSR